MRVILCLSAIALILSACQKNDDPIAKGGFPGSLDSVVFFRSLDSVTHLDRQNILTYSYDASGRVTQINLGDKSYRNFFYQGNNILPFKQIDSIGSVTSADYVLHDHRYTYDNLNRVILDNITRYERWAPGGDSVFSDAYDRIYKYEQNYLTSKNTNFTVCHFSDTSFFNNHGDFTRLSFNCLDRYVQFADEYYSVKNPFAALNIYPVYEALNHTLLWVSIQNLNFNIFQPKFMYKKLTGTNAVYYDHNEDDSLIVNFHIGVDQNNNITDLVIVKYTYYYDFSGNLDYDKLFGLYKFYYHP